MYSPKIDTTQVRKLYLLKMSYASLGLNKPMTQIVKEALDKHIPEKAHEILKAGGTLLEPAEILKKELGR
jgi:hypothetical protein